MTELGREGDCGCTYSGWSVGTWYLRIGCCWMHYRRRWCTPAIGFRSSRIILGNHMLSWSICCVSPDCWIGRILGCTCAGRSGSGSSIFDAAQLCGVVRIWAGADVSDSWGVVEGPGHARCGRGRSRESRRRWVGLPPTARVGRRARARKRRVRLRGARSWRRASRSDPPLLLCCALAEIMIAMSHCQWLLRRRRGRGRLLFSRFADGHRWGPASDGERDGDGHGWVWFGCCSILSKGFWTLSLNATRTFGAQCAPYHLNKHM